MTNCENIRESIGPWLDGELKPAEADAVRVHVADCAPCGKQRRQLEKLHVTLKNALTAEAARLEYLSFWRGVQRRIEQKRAWHEELIDSLRDFFTAPRIAWSVPVAIALALGVVSLESYMPAWRSGAPRNNFAAVDSIDAYGRSVALLRENETRTTVIWLYQNQEGENEAAEDTTTSGPAF